MIAAAALLTISSSSSSGSSGSASGHYDEHMETRGFLRMESEGLAEREWDVA
jgi:hypothetical protein